MKFSPSLLAASGLDLRSAIALAVQARADALHVDVMDGHFVPNIAFGPDLVDELISLSPLPVHVHLMVAHPRQWVKAYSKAAVLAFHWDADENPLELLRSLSEGPSSWVAFSPGTDLEALPVELGHAADGLLVMGVEPGWSGQAMLPQTVERVKTLSRRFPGCEIAVDGGVVEAQSLAQAGASWCIVGSTFYGAHEPVRRLQDMRLQLNSCEA